jgi:multimeric flavodoxin WrbA
MKIMAFNGSPRKNWNTAALLEKALEGAASAGADTELIHLYDLNYKGCISCFACKLKDGKSYGKCAMNDELTPILAKVNEADAIVIGSPNYIGGPSAMAKGFLERLLYPYLVYKSDMISLFNKRIKTGFIYTMGAQDERMKEMGYAQAARFIEMAMEMIFGSAESLIVNDTYQFDDYSKYVSTRFDPEAKAIRRAKQFPIDCQHAFDMGARLVYANC